MDKLNIICYLSLFIKVPGVTKDTTIVTQEETEKIGIIAMIKISKEFKVQM